ncbi:fungal-specific transcription factor domain-containing protein [Mycena polygramma]|nr:fungal-specific transcription factor domain-containing protein [Mycena polygramma]
MSFSDDESRQDPYRGKKRRLDRACDLCRRRKSRCTSTACTICTAANLECTYNESMAPRTTTRTQIESLEAQLDQSEALVRRLRAQLANTHISNGNAPSLLQNATNNEDRNTAEESAMCLYFLRSALRGPAPSHADDLPDLEMEWKDVSIGAMPDRRFIGKSSGAQLIKAAVALKATVKREESEVDLKYCSTPEQPLAMDDSPYAHNQAHHRCGTSSWPSRRLRYWTWKPWETTAHRTHAYGFPSESRMAQLIELYFMHVNMYLPLLHRPTFQRSITDGLHLRNDGFAATVLLVCAIASRWEGNPSARDVDLGCGWEWFEQVPLVGNHLFGHATLYDLQYYCLAVQFLDGSSAPQARWTLIGLGLRLAQDIGCHRRPADEVPSVERELYKRAFWVLVYLDRIISWHMGRPCAVQHDDFDIDFPIECDDEYWEHPVHPFQQPLGVPSRVTFFNAIMRLQHILAFSLKILYGLKKMSQFFMPDDTWEENAVAELDSALNNWHQQIPEHLRWDPAREDPVFFDQSVALYCAYYQLQILIHRPFIPMLHMRKFAPTALPSLAICTNAARACANMVDIQRRRKGSVPVAINMSAAFTSGIILLLNVWSGRRKGLVSDPNREMAHVHKCMEVMRLCEKRWQSAGLLWDILAELASVGQLPLPNAPLYRGAGTSSMQNEGDIRSGGSERLSAGGVTGIHGIDEGSRTMGPVPIEPSPFALASSFATWVAPVDLYAQNPRQDNHEPRDMLNLIDSDTIAMWTNTPMGLEVDDWGTYLSNFNEITQGQYTQQWD